MQNYSYSEMIVEYSTRHEVFGLRRNVGFRDFWIFPEPQKSEIVMRVAAIFFKCIEIHIVEN